MGLVFVLRCLYQVVLEIAQDALIKMRSLRHLENRLMKTQKLRFLLSFKRITVPGCLF